MTVPLLKRTLATFRSPELGFFGFVVPTRKQTPFISGRLIKAGETGLRAFCPTLHPRKTWLYVACVVGVLEKDRVANGATLGASGPIRQDRAGAGRRNNLLKSCEAIVGNVETRIDSPMGIWTTEVDFEGPRESPVPKREASCLRHQQASPHPVPPPTKLHMNFTYICLTKTSFCGNLREQRA